MVSYKGVDVLINSLPYISKDIKVFIAGEGIKSKSIKLNFKKYENIKFFNKFLTDNEKQYILKKATAFLFPSISEAETLGLTQIEAMSQGCPVINTNLKTAVPYVSLNNYTGKTIIPNDCQSLANAINKFPNRNSTEWSYYSKNSINRFKLLFSYQAFDNQSDIVFKKLMNTSK